MPNEGNFRRIAPAEGEDARVPAVNGSTERSEGFARTSFSVAFRRPIDLREEVCT